MRRISSSTVIAVVALSACTAVRGINGRMEQGDETFRGSISGSGYREGSGEMTLVSNHQVTCKGSFVYTSRRRGEGVLNCGDGRSGAFHVWAVNNVGNGVGELNGRRFTFRFDAT